MQSIISFLKFIITSNALNFVLMLIILGWIVKKLNVGKSFENAVEDVQKGIVKSEDEKSRAKISLNEAEVLIGHLDDDVKELEQNSAEKSKVFSEQIEQGAQNTISNLKTNIDGILNLEAKKLSNLVSQNASKASLEAAKTYLTDLFNDNQELHNKFIQNSLDELDKVEL